MNSNSLNTPQLTIRKIPWLTVSITVCLSAVYAWLWINRQNSVVATLVFSAIILFSLLFSEMVICKFNRYERKVMIDQRRIWRSFQHKFSFEDLYSVSVQKSFSSDESQPTYRILFVLKTAELIPLLSAYTTGKRAKEKLARKIVEYINQTATTPVEIALDGLVRVRQEGNTQGVNWKMEYIINNDDVPLTSLCIAHQKFSHGFILIMPVLGAPSGAISGRMNGTILRKMYSPYLKMFSLKPQDLPGFGQSELIKGERIGLKEHFTILTSEPTSVLAWLNDARIRQLLTWQEMNILDTVHAASDPHILFNKESMQIIFRGKFNQPQQVAEIIRFGSTLLENK